MAIQEIIKNRAIVHYKYFLRSLRKVSVHYGVGKSTLARWLHERGIKKPVKRRRRSKVTEEMNTFIESTLSSNPCHTAQDLSRLLQERFCMSVSLSTIARRLKSMKFSWKRLRRRVVNKASISKFDYDAFKAGYIGAKRLISVDESSFYFNDTPRYGYSKRNLRCAVCVPTPRKRRRVTLLMAVSEERIVGYQIFEGSANTDRFVNFLDALDIQPGDAVLMDNVAFHHSKRVVENLHSKRARPLFIPPYSPEYNPIEMVFSKVKAFFRKNFWDALTTSDSSVIASIASVSSDNLKSFFNHTNRIVLKNVGSTST
jgi:transposase